MRVLFKIVLLGLILITTVISKAQAPLSIAGDWKCFKHDYRGLEKFSLKQAEQIRKTTLHISKQSYTFLNVSFIPTCHFYKWVAKPWDAGDYVQVLAQTYTERQLKTLRFLETVDEKGEWVCPDECSFFLKDKMLITNCGGYIFYWKKVSKIKQLKIVNS